MPILKPNTVILMITTQANEIANNVVKKHKGVDILCSLAVMADIDLKYSTTNGHMNGLEIFIDFKR